MVLDKDVTQFYEEKASPPDEGSFTEVINRVLREHMHAHEFLLDRFSLIQDFEVD